MDPINVWFTFPFVLLLGSIALLPLLASHWWEKHYAKVVTGLGLVCIFYYIAVLQKPGRMLETAHEYFSFICLIGSLFVVSGGIKISVKGESTPWVNTCMLAIGGILANFIGTTGASMLLIRPFLRANKYRVTSYHVVFFIFIVSNIGGCLTPLGDPPLYLGYLRGVPFAWTISNLFPMWFLGMIWTLAIFFFLDWRNFRRAPIDIREKETLHETWKLEGKRNFLWLGIILLSLFINTPVFLRESLMFLAAFFSYRTTNANIHEANHFSWAPLKEVAILFAGIFTTMVPALDWLESHASSLGFVSPGSFYWGSGILSSVLDNAPTYLNFVSAAFGTFSHDISVQVLRDAVHQGMSSTGPTTTQYSTEVLQTVAYLRDNHPSVITSGIIPGSIVETSSLLANHIKHLIAISVGCVFFGANTYIGNGPNLMVKNIAVHAGVKAPSFFGYIFKYTIPFLLPMYVILYFIFFAK